MLADGASLESYRRGEVVEFKDVKRRLLLEERKGSPKIPDQFYRLAITTSVQDIDSLAGLLRRGLGKISSHFLDHNGHSFQVFVKDQFFNDWQAMLTHVPPLVLQSLYWDQQFPILDHYPATLQDYVDNVVRVNCQYTALPHPLIPALESWLLAEEGLSDLHMHLMGSTETDIAWQDFLTAPKEVYEFLQGAISEEKVREQLEQETLALSPDDFYKLLQQAQKIRQVIFDLLFPGHAAVTYPGDVATVLRQHVLLQGTTYSGHHHPFKTLLSKSQQHLHSVCAEGLMYALVWKALRERRGSVVAPLFHFYLLILGLANRLLVQQMHQYGFEQFQKITLNKLREFSEKQFAHRFFQMQGNQLRNLKFLEGRFSPKDDEGKNKRMIDGIVKGWSDLRNRSHAGVPENAGPQLRLIAHFIKAADKDYTANYRHQQLRAEVWKKAKVLSYMIRKKPFQNLIVGIDAAASEFDAPPEVFAPAFRYLRRENFEHFTYHAGEDFYHLLGGLRAIHEAVHFCELGEGDRIGHATAAGIDTGFWSARIGKEIYIMQGEWLDDLLFLYAFIRQRNIVALLGLLPAIQVQIQNLIGQVYRTAGTVDEHIVAWQCRKWCPMQLMAVNYLQASALSVFDFDEWIQGRVAAHPTTIKILGEYHSSFGRRRYEKSIEVETEGLLTAHQLHLIQKEMLQLLHERGIVIETLPTSNVRIGHYEHYHQYHLKNWQQWRNMAGYQLPDIVVGTDDTGIFATNIFNEYAHLFCVLRKDLGDAAALAFIQSLQQNADVRRFV